MWWKMKLLRAVFVCWRCLRTNLAVFLRVLMSARAPGIVLYLSLLISSGLHPALGAIPEVQLIPETIPGIFAWFQAFRGELFCTIFLKDSVLH